ncbi:MAG: hypothetical protein V4694_04990 [Pseudomonadota bacterium]
MIRILSRQILNNSRNFRNSVSTRQFSSFVPDKIFNPYNSDENDQRNSNFSALIYRTILEDTKSGPATVLFPGIPIQLFSTTSYGILSLEPLEKGRRVYTSDASTLLPIADLNVTDTPLITVPALFKLILKHKELSGGTSIPYNETWTEAKDKDIVICMADEITNNLISDYSSLEKDPNLSHKRDDITFYDPKKGQVFHLNFDKNDKSDISVEIGDMIKFPRNIFTIENVENDPEMQKFIDDCYEEAKEEVAYFYITNPQQQNNVSDDLTITNILIGDAKSLIAAKGEDYIVEKVEASLAHLPSGSLKPIAVGKVKPQRFLANPGQSLIF